MLQLFTLENESMCLSEYKPQRHLLWRFVYIPLKGLLRMSETNMSKEQACGFRRKVEDEGHKLNTTLNVPPKRPTKYKAQEIFIGDESSG